VFEPCLERGLDRPGVIDDQRILDRHLPGGPLGEVIR
jgi:hypothetical protein